MKFRVAALVLGLAGPAAAHDFWIQPLRFQTPPGIPLTATFQLGHAEFRQRWGLGADHVLLLSDLSPQGRRDLRADLQLVGGDTDLVTRFSTSGLHVIAMQSAYAASDLPAIRFNDYAKAEGLALVMANRQRAGTNNASGRERYSRRGKALVQVGAQTPADAAFATRPIGLKLEIVPERSPYGLDATRILPLRVLYKGHRLAGATVKLTSLEFDSKPIATAVTDRDGRARFRVPAVGDWLVNVIWSEPIGGDGEFDTTFSSMTFGYDPGSRRR